LAFLSAFGRYLPSRVVPSAEIGARVGSDAEWILNVSGIEERRFANGETVAEMAAKAAADCLERAGVKATEIGMIIVGSGSAERRFPGPAASVAQALGATNAVGLDLPMASAGSLFGLSIASRLASWYTNILVIGSEKMSSVVMKEPMERGVAILFGDGAGACLIRKEQGFARVIDSEIRTDGTYTEDLRLEFEQPLMMNGRSVIMQASRKIPSVISSLLERNQTEAADVPVFLMHQANQNLIDRVAAALGVESERFFSNIRRYGNTSSASMLIAASEWFEQNSLAAGEPMVFAAFGAGFHWGALLAEGI
jgi:3-oxoacyl-[acyl-carrier-protein] synthase III